MTVKPGRPFWAGFTAFCANMTALFGVDQLAFTQNEIQVYNWWAAMAVSFFVGAAVYGKEKISNLTDSKQEPVQ